jgi:hypothetical protein
MAILDLASYKQYMNISSTTNDTEIIRMLNAVNIFIPSYCNREFTTYYNTNKVEYFDGTLEEYYPQEYPIVSVVSLEYSSLNDGNYDEELAQYTDYIIDDTSSRIVAVGSQFIYTNIPINSMKLTYKGGYDRYPEDIVLAAALLTQHYVNEEYTPRKSLAGASIDNVIIPDQMAKLPLHVRLLLDRHRTQVI